jgi:tetratricopeptide (TPR) repeat protein
MELTRYESPAVVWAPETVFKVRDKMDGKEVKETALELYDQATSIDYPYPRSWFGIGYLLYKEENYQEALDAFDRAQVRAPGRSPWSQTYGLIIFTALTWQGHIYDILGQREKALEKYNAALVCEPEVVGTGYLSTTYCGLKIDRSWVEERLKTRFVRD